MNLAVALRAHTDSMGVQIQRGKREWLDRK